MNWKRVKTKAGQDVYINLAQITMLQDDKSGGTIMFSSSGAKTVTPLSVTELFALPDETED